MSFKKHFLRILMSMQAIKKRKLGELSFTEAWEIKQKNGYRNDYVTVAVTAAC